MRIRDYIRDGLAMGQKRDNTSGLQGGSGRDVWLVARKRRKLPDAPAIIAVMV